MIFFIISIVIALIGLGGILIFSGDSKVSIVLFIIGIVGMIYLGI